MSCLAEENENADRPDLLLILFMSQITQIVLWKWKGLSVNCVLIFKFYFSIEHWQLFLASVLSCTLVSLKPQTPPRLLLRWLRLNKPTTSYYDSNPSNGLVINKTHIVAEGGEKTWGDGGRGLGHFHFNRLSFGKKSKKKTQIAYEDSSEGRMYVCVCVWISADLNVWGKSNVFHAQRCTQAEYCCFCLSPFLSAVIILSPSDPKACSLNAFWHRILTPAPSHFFVTFLGRRCHRKLFDADWG